MPAKRIGAKPLTATQRSARRRAKEQELLKLLATYRDRFGPLEKGLEDNRAKQLAALRAAREVLRTIAGMPELNELADQAWAALQNVRDALRETRE